MLESVGAFEVFEDETGAAVSQPDRTEELGGSHWEAVQEAVVHGCLPYQTTAVVSRGNVRVLGRAVLQEHTARASCEATGHDLEAERTLVDRRDALDELDTLRFVNEDGREHCRDGGSGRAGSSLDHDSQRAAARVTSGIVAT